MRKYLKKDDYRTVGLLGFLMHNTVRNHRPKLPSYISTGIVI